MNQIEALSQEDIHLLSIYKNMIENKPVTGMTIEDIPKIPALIEELKQAEETDKKTIEKISKIEDFMREKEIQLQTLRAQLNKKLQYLHMEQQKPKPVHTRTTNGSNPINKESVLDILKSNPSLGNSGICDKLGIPNDKANQNRTYLIVKALMKDGVISEDRTIV